jgi:CheY-like chemotaxis protein
VGVPGGQDRVIGSSGNRASFFRKSLRNKVDEWLLAVRPQRFQTNAKDPDRRRLRHNPKDGRASLRPLDEAEFVEAGNGLEAIEQIALGPVALIILDLNMLDMHGVDVLKFLRRHQGCRDVPVVVLTTRGDEASRETALGISRQQGGT